ncbi:MULTISPECIES: three component ABC system middle component [Bacillus cereus group]|uniref:three component ABC system middle component n=1 Tax=Bacillus cereus group TaxID=86661 RepID=UPI000BEB52C8|nr:MULTISPECIES: three component ABC system middle component [Bacillus cereus group]PEB96044.1 hypothetical protein CON04_26980 [Bacillus cereus]PEC25370.1 hypothetical protein CON75_23975 [Bacillus thuringiensis]PEQ74647.1 hypothetical protein CN478_21225 [Bacillus cereus]PFM68514.1 hypothetical protein COJ66_20990 [Bacillus cereus]PFZ19025.1 hypothetical protein COL73_17770 [Bacillus thuringiensis]
MEIEHLKTLSLNPFLNSKIIRSFVSGYGKEYVNIELLYLVLPFVFDGYSREILTSVNKSSTIYTAFLNSPEKRIVLGNLQERYEYMKSLTNEALIVAHNERAIILEHKVKLIKGMTYKNVRGKEMKSFLRASYYLGMIFSKSSNVDIFRRLGVNNI